MARKTKTLHKIKVKLDDKGINNLVDLAKGRIYSPAGDWFYKLFRKPTVDEAREALQEAWWIEEDDLRQQIYISLWHVRNGKNYNMIDENLVVAYMLRDYMESVNRHHNRERFFAAYQYDIEMAATDPAPEEQRSLDIVFEKNHTLPTLDRYMMYLSMMLGMTNEKVAKSMLVTTDVILYRKSKLRQKLGLMEE